MTSPLQSYRSAVGKSLEKLASEFGVNKTTVMRWEDRRVPAERVLEIEDKTGIPRWQLRPDLWQRPRPSEQGAAA